MHSLSMIMVVVDDIIYQTVGLNFLQNEKFWKVCEKGDIAAVREAIKNGEAEVNWIKDGSPYHVCCIHEHYITITIALSKQN